MRRVIEIAELVPDDWARWRELRLLALTESPDAFSSMLGTWARADEARWRARLAEVAYNIVAELDGRAVGMASGVDGDEIELISLYVAPEARGKGVGDALVRAIVEWAGTRPTKLRLYPDNARALALYTRNGFVPIGIEDGELAMVRR